MALTTLMEFTQTVGIVSVLLDHTRTRGTSVARMRYFFVMLSSLWSSWAWYSSLIYFFYMVDFCLVSEKERKKDNFIYISDEKGFLWRGISWARGKRQLVPNKAKQSVPISWVLEFRDSPETGQRKSSDSQGKVQKQSRECPKTF